MIKLIKKLILFFYHDAKRRNRGLIEGWLNIQKRISKTLRTSKIGKTIHKPNCLTTKALDKNDQILSAIEKKIKSSEKLKTHEMQKILRENKGKDLLPEIDVSKSQKPPSKLR